MLENRLVMPAPRRWPAHAHGVLQDLVARDDATIGFIKHHMTTEFDSAPPL